METLDEQVVDYFQYIPSIAAASVAISLFFVVSLAVTIQTVTCRISRPRYMWVVVFTGSLEVGGYIARLVARQQADLSAYITSLVLVIMAPNFLALVSYYASGKAAQLAGLKGRLFTPRNIAILWFGVDIVTIGVQGGGSAVISSTLQDTGVASHSGETTVLIGLAIQLFFFFLFACLTVYIYRADRRAASWVPIQVYMCMWLTMLGITIRNIYRIVEIGIGWAGYLNTHEVFFYCLDALPILLTFLVFIVLPYGKYLPDQSLVLERHQAAPPAKDGLTTDGQAKSQDESTNVLATV